ncbi:MAG: molybdenum ABC transporter ATP-binding protein [Pseudomonadales bacterium]|nr:molybdenum ABC transporter ATP-binding protein [Pseudomonadales bacterium]
MSEKTIDLRFNLPRHSFDLYVDISIPSTGVTAIFGQSGCGKTTFLRCVAGLEKDAVGSLNIAGQQWQSDTVNLPTHKRSIGYVFQESALFSHLSVKANLEFGVKRAGTNRNSDYSQRFDQIASMLHISHLLERDPLSLSGGEKQRVAIARALLLNPDILLMDEPLSSLDEARKQEVLPYLEELKSTFATPILYVSHSPNEIARLADHMVVLENGKVVADGPLVETLSRIDFPVQLGEDAGVVLEAAVLEINAEWHLAKVQFAGGELWVRDGGFPVGAQVRVRILARDVSLANSHHIDSSIVNILHGKVEVIENDAHPAMALIKVRVQESALIARITRRSANYLDLKIGDAIWVQVKSAALIR